MREIGIPIVAVVSIGVVVAIFKPAPPTPVKPAKKEPSTQPGMVERWQRSREKPEQDYPTTKPSLVDRVKIKFEKPEKE